MDSFTVRHWILLFCFVSFTLAVKWPRGTYTLVKPKTGCPAGWLEGWRFQDNENDANQNRVSYGHHFYGIIGTHPRDLNTSYCTKDLNDSNHEGYWPRGNYCILKHGSVCPPGGFRTGIVYWDDEDSNNKNRAGGELPRGIFNSNTMVYYCCRNDGLYSNAIRLPKSKPFYLLRHNIYSYCQQVEGMNVREETVYTDDQDGRNGNWVAGSTPYGPSDGKRNYRLYYCYYYSI